MTPAETPPSRALPGRKLWLAIAAVAGLGLVVAGYFIVAHVVKNIEARQDKEIVDYVYDHMVPSAISEVGRGCLLPSRSMNAVLRFETKNRAISFTSLTVKPFPADWSAANRACVLATFQEFTRSPGDIKIPGGREYEIDLHEVQFPPAQGRN